MAKWVRALHRQGGETGRWHLLDSDKDFFVADTLCGEQLPAALEVSTSDEKTERDGRCTACERDAATNRGETAAATPRR